MNRLNVDVAPEGERNAPHVVARQQRFHFLSREISKRHSWFRHGRFSNPGWALVAGAP
jgi:hypothetical protein